MNEHADIFDFPNIWVWQCVQRKRKFCDLPVQEAKIEKPIKEFGVESHQLMDAVTTYWASLASLVP